MFPWVLWAALANNQIQGGGGHGNLRFVAKSDVSDGYPGDLWPAIGIWSGGESCGAEPLTCRVWCCHQIDSIRIELHCSTPSWCRRISWCGKHPPTSGVWSVVSVVIVCVKEKHRRKTWGFSCTLTQRGLHEATIRLLLVDSRSVFSDRARYRT